MSIEMKLAVRSAETGGQLDMRVYVLDLYGDEEAHVWPITVCIEPRGGPTKEDSWETAFDLTPTDAATLRDYLDLLLRIKPWLPSEIQNPT
jgi:hypothetical protein